MLGSQNEQQSSIVTCKGLQYFVKRLNQLRSDCVMLNRKEGTLSVVTGGYSVIKTFDTAKLLQSLSITTSLQLTGISDARGSNL